MDLTFRTMPYRHGFSTRPCRHRVVVIVVVLAVFSLALQMLISLSVEFIRTALLLFGFPGDRNNQNVLETDIPLCIQHPKSPPHGADVLG